MYTCIKNITFFFVLACIGFFPIQAHAFQKTTLAVPAQNDFVVEPGKTEILLQPGESAIKEISITSRIDRKTHFRLSTEDLVGSNDPTQTVVLLGNEHGPYSLKDFIIPEIYEFDLSLGERITIPVTISIPADAEPRGYYGALIVAADPAESQSLGTNEAEGKTRVISRIGSLFLIKVPGEGREEGAIENFKPITPAKLFYENRPEGFEVAFNNTGNVHLVPYGKITIKNMLGMKVSELPVDAYFVLPDSIRYREIMWQDGFSVGRYTAELSLYRGYGEESEERTISFWILPWKLLVAIFAGIVLIIGLIYYITARFEIKRK